MTWLIYWTLSEIKIARVWERLAYIRMREIRAFLKLAKGGASNVNYTLIRVRHTNAIRYDSAHEAHIYAC